MRGRTLAHYCCAGEGIGLTAEFCIPNARNAIKRFEKPESQHAYALHDRRTSEIFVSLSELRVCVNEWRLHKPM